MGRGLIKALTCLEGRGALTPCVSWGWRGLEKKMWPTAPRIISGTALSVDLVTGAITTKAGPVARRHLVNGVEDSGELASSTLRSPSLELSSLRELKTGQN